MSFLSFLFHNHPYLSSQTGCGIFCNIYTCECVYVCVCPPMGNHKRGNNAPYRLHVLLKSPIQSNVFRPRGLSLSHTHRHTYTDIHWPGGWSMLTPDVLRNLRKFQLPIISVKSTFSFPLFLSPDVCVCVCTNFDSPSTIYTGLPLSPN